ncbi:type IV toxin-antitoxin system AbiEi family antitoxin [bacterium]
MKQGRFTFTLEEVAQVFSKQHQTLHMAMRRLVRMERVTRVRNGFYVIIPVHLGKPPCPLFIHDLMRFLNRSYYLGLTSASSFYTIESQIPQVWTVMTSKPTLRTIYLNDCSISFILKNEMPQTGIQMHNMESGSLHVSSPILTALDLIQYQRQSGGFNRIVEMIVNLSPLMTSKDLQHVLINKFPDTVLQRFGYICDTILNRSDLREIIYDYLKNKSLHAVSLSPSAKTRSGVIHKIWQIIENVDELKRIQIWAVRQLAGHNTQEYTLRSDMPEQHGDSTAGSLEDLLNQLILDID